MGHQDGHVISGEAHVVVDQQPPALFLDLLLHGLHQLFRRCDVPSHGTDISLYNAHRDLHGSLLREQVVKNYKIAIPVVRPDKLHPNFNNSTTGED